MNQYETKIQQNIRTTNTTFISKADFNSVEDYQFLRINDSLKMAYLDIGNPEKPLVVLLHGEPNSSFVYRNIAPKIVAKGFRVIIPDLIGFGYSDKPKHGKTYTYTNHTKWLNSFFNKLNYKNLFFAFLCYYTCIEK